MAGRIGRFVRCFAEQCPDGASGCVATEQGTPFVGRIVVSGGRGGAPRRNHCAREVAAAVPLAALQELPEGARFVARQGPLAVETRRRGDTLVVTARSDSLPRKVVRTIRTEIRRQRDSAATRCSEYRTQRADSIRRESRTETVAAPARSCGRWWFVAGAVCCAAVFAGIRRWL